MSNILIFEDDPKERHALDELVRKRCGNVVLTFDEQCSLKKDVSYETHIGKWIDTQCKKKQIGLIVCDKELGRYAQLRGLSATPIAAVALQRGIPFCQYSRQPSGKEMAQFKRLMQWSSEQITLDGLEAADWAPQIECLYNGFERLHCEYKKVKKTKGTTPAGALAQILGHSESESRVALYGAGDQGFLREIMTYYDPDRTDMPALYARMPRVLGNWLFLSILRFPGILVNHTAAASYLNIACRDFDSPKVCALFKKAKYSGPFHNHSLGPWWWRSELDTFVHGAGFKDGLEYIKSRGYRKAKECRDAQTRERAGYYCMLMREPVSLENSRGNISWFPSGADLARIRKDKFESITALIGMY